ASAVEPLAVSGTSVIVIVNPQFLTQIKHLHKLFDTLACICAGAHRAQKVAKQILAVSADEASEPVPASK
ncbi:hypothetical protein PWJ82_09100, partial [Actinotignum schaalii]|uniref:hypothetical protein n=3 Tax=Actinotignum TaxID=1653174 RepID=UPI00237D574B